MEQPKTGIALTAPRITPEGWRIARIDDDGTQWVSLMDVLKINLIPYLMALSWVERIEEEAKAAGVKVELRRGRTSGEKGMLIDILDVIIAERR